MEYFKGKNIKIPRLGFGTWQLNPKTAGQTICYALEMGLRHIDTAQIYNNEEAVGEAVRKSSISREDIFLTTKLWANHLLGEASVIKGTEESLKKLKTDYVDLLLIHWPFSEMPREECLKALSKLKDSGKIRFIGVSNFTKALLKEALDFCPQIVTNQVEYHPLLSQETLLQTAKEHKIFLTAYCPLARGHIMKIKQLEVIGKKYGKTPAQVTLRWLIDQENVVVIFKSDKLERIKSNFDIFDFQLESEDRKKIQKLTYNKKRIVNPTFAPQWDR